MTGAWHGGKGDKTCPEAKPGSYAENFPAIDWNAREAEKQRPDMLRGTSGNASPHGVLTYNGIPIIWDPVIEDGPEARRAWALLNGREHG